MKIALGRARIYYTVSYCSKRAVSSTFHLAVLTLFSSLLLFFSFVFLSQPTTHMRCKSFYRVLFRDFIVWEFEALNPGEALLFRANLFLLPPPQPYPQAHWSLQWLRLSFTLLHLYQALPPCVPRSALHKALTLRRPPLYQNPSHDTSLLAFHSCYIIFFVLTKKLLYFFSLQYDSCKGSSSRDPPSTYSDPQLDLISPFFYCPRQNIPPPPWEL